MTGLERDRATFENSAQGQAYQQDAGNIDRRNAAQNQRFGQLYNQANFSNQAQQQSFDQRLADRQQQNAAQAQDFSQYGANRQLANQAQQQRYNQQIGNRSFEHQAQQQQYDQQRALANDFNSNTNQLFNQQMAASQQQNAARGQSLQEMFALRNQPLNEIAALLSGSQVGNPNFSVNTPGAIPTTDYAGIVGQNYNQQLQQAQMQAAQSGDLLGGLAGLGSAAIMRGSDMRIKSDIEKVGEVDGLGIYEYVYEWGGPRRRGFIAQEVQAVRPEAVHRFGGTLILDYAQLPEAA